MKTDLQSDFDIMKDDFGVSVILSGTTVTLTGVRNSLDKEIVYSDTVNKSVEYKFTLWLDVADITDAGLSVPEPHTEVSVDSKTLLIAQRTYDPLEALVALDMVEQYG